MKNKNVRNIIITIFVIIWTVVFHYESVRYFYLDRLVGKSLPKVKFLFPPAGWIMFFNVDDRFGYAEVYGMKDGVAQLIDPHDIIRTRFIGFDNIHRNVLSTMLSRRNQKPFCDYMERRFPYFDYFLVSAIHYPSLTTNPYQRLQRVYYQCRAQDNAANP